MIIKVPQGYIFEKEGSIVAFEEEGRLKLRAWNTRFHEIMYDLTYTIKGSTRCFYCGKEVKRSKITLDHVYPASLGGPTVPINLVPACRNCNSTKGDMTPEQFKIYMGLDSKEKKKEFYKAFSSAKFFQKRWLHILPSEWITNANMSELIALIQLYDTSTHKYEKTEEYYLRCGQFPKPIIIDCHRFVLDGFTEVLYAKNNKIKEIPAIVLENVEVVFE